MINESASTNFVTCYKQTYDSSTGGLNSTGTFKMHYVSWKCICAVRPFVCWITLCQFWRLYSFDFYDELWLLNWGGVERSDRGPY